MSDSDEIPEYDPDVRPPLIPAWGQWLFMIIVIITFLVMIAMGCYAFWHTSSPG